MSTRELLLREVEAAPEPLLQEVLDFLRFVRHSRFRDDGENDTKGIDFSLTNFAKDWDTPEEDEAWAYLSEASIS